MSIIFGEKLLHINICQHKCKHFKGLLLSQVSNIVKSRLVSLVETQNKFQMLQLIVISDCWKICNIALNKKNLHHFFQSLTVASKFGNANHIYLLTFKFSCLMCIYVGYFGIFGIQENLKITVYQIFFFHPFFEAVVKEAHFWLVRMYLLLSQYRVFKDRANWSSEKITWRYLLL